MCSSGNGGTPRRASSVLTSWLHVALNKHVPASGKRQSVQSSHHDQPIAKNPDMLAEARKV